MTDGPTLRSLLDRLGSVVRLGPRDHLAIERLVRSRESWAPGELRAAIASVLARSSEQWQRIAAVYDECLLASNHPGEAARGPTDETARVQVALVPETDPSVPKRLAGWFRDSRTKLVRSLGNAPRGLWATGVALAIIIPLVALVVWLMPNQPVPPPVEVSEKGDSVPVEIVEPEDGVVLLLTDLDQDLDPKVRVQPPPLDLPRLLGLALLSMALSAFGLSWIRLPEQVRKQRLVDSEAQQRRADRRRRALQEGKASAGRALRVRYHVDLHLPVSRQAVLDSAEHLGRIYGESPGADLDAESTLDRTVASAGRFERVLEPRRLRHDVVLLVDTEVGNHPWLDAFLRLVDAWRAQGIVFRVYRFPGSPDLVVDSDTKQPIRLDELARQTEDLPMVIFSRQLDPAARTGEAPWLGVVGAWPRRAWLDPDPRPRGELERHRKRAIWELERRGLNRFHLTDGGLVAVAQHLQGVGEGPRPTSRDQPMPPSPEVGQESESPIAEALRLWALVAALVPNPTWDQLEAIRRHFPEIHGPLPEPRYLQRLLEWVEDRSHQSAELGGGRGLAIPFELQDTWLREQRRRELDGPNAPKILRRARQLLLQQLEPTRPEDPADLEMWRFKRSMHQAMLAPRRAAELLGWIGESAVRHEALRWLKVELARREEDFGVALPPRDREVLAALVATGDRVPMGLLFSARPERESNPLWLDAFWGAAVLLLTYSLLKPWVDERYETQVPSVVVERPMIYDLQERSDLPTMVTLEGGSFQMGSADSDWDAERPVHQVEIAAFEISKTEVTVAQYRACFEAGRCMEPSPVSSCNWDVEERDDHPINCVSWHDARDYAEWMGARLPSEAEWEYAARSGGLDREYPWGNEPATCERAVVSEQQLGSGCDGIEHTQPVCSKPAGNTDHGLCNMGGNVWEWVEDDWHGNFNGAPRDGSPWIDDPRASSRVVRGGSWWNDPRYVRVAARYRVDPSYRNDAYLGFRVARSLPSVR